MAFDNPDHVAIVIHNYRWRLGLAQGDSKYDDLESKLADGPVIAVPAITMEGDANGAGLHRLRRLIAGNFRANMNFGWPKGALGIICRRKAGGVYTSDRGCFAVLMDAL